MKTALLLFTVFAWASFASGLSVMESSETGVTLNLSSAIPEFGTISLRGGTYTTISMDNAENLAEVGFPRVPVYRVWVEIPIGARVDALVNEHRLETIGHDGAPVVPAVQSAPKSLSRDEYTMSFAPEVYASGSAYPENWVRIVYAGGMRGRNLALVEVMPLRWNVQENSFTLLAGAEIELQFQGGDLAASYEQASRLATSQYERILENMLVNYGTFEQAMDTPPAPYLIVGHSDFVDTAMDDFVSHKEALGFDVEMVDLSVTGSTADEIQDYIQNAINEGVVYVLLVGDDQFLPGGSAVKYGGVTDLYYACLDDGGWVPDAFIGRFSVTTTGETVTMAQRVIDYENSVGVQSWVQNALFIASNDNYNITEGTHNYCIDNYLTPRGYTSIKVYPVTTGGTAADAVAAINAGLSMVTFSGHGSTTSWGDMSFPQSSFNQLTNDGMFPGVLSHACITGDFSVSTCWGETWTRTPERGGLWFWGSVPNSFWDEDDIQQIGEFEAFLGNDVYWPKGFLNQGLMAVYEYYSGGGSTQYYFEGYTLFGDPSVIMKTWPMTGIEDFTSGIVSSPVSVSAPNPVMGSVPVSLTGTGGPASVEIFDVTGRVIARPFQGELNGQATFTWDASSVSTGVYFMRLTQGGSMATARVSVIR